MLRERRHIAVRLFRLAVVLCAIFFVALVRLLQWLVSAPEESVEVSSRQE